MPIGLLVFIFFIFFFHFFFHIYFCILFSYFVFIFFFQFIFFYYFFGVRRKEPVILRTPNLPNQGSAQYFLRTCRTKVRPCLFSKPARVWSSEKGTGLSPNAEPGFGRVLSPNSKPAEPGLYPVLSPNYEPAEPGLTWSSSKLRTETPNFGQKHNPVPFCTSDPQMRTFANNEDPDEMPHNATVHHSLHCKDKKIFREIKNGFI